jgi:hypothetical protein
MVTSRNVVTLSVEHSASFVTAVQLTVRSSQSCWDVKPVFQLTQTVTAVSSAKPHTAAEKQFVAEPEATFSMVTA